MHAPIDRNITALLILLVVWIMRFLHYNYIAIHPYTEEISKLPAHFQPVHMESHAMHVSRHGVELDFEVLEVDFEEPRTLRQHSFFQRFHMGQVVPCMFIGFMETENPTCQDGEPVSNQDELM